MVRERGCDFVWKEMSKKKFEDLRLEGVEIEKSSERMPHSQLTFLKSNRSVLDLKLHIPSALGAS